MDLTELAPGQFDPWPPNLWVLRSFGSGVLTGLTGLRLLRSRLYGPAHQLGGLGQFLEDCWARVEDKYNIFLLCNALYSEESERCVFLSCEERHTHAFPEVSHPQPLRAEPAGAHASHLTRLGRRPVTRPRYSPKDYTH